MLQRQKCCMHCPGTLLSSSKDRRDEHTCCLPTYVSGNLKLSSLRKVTPGEEERAKRLRGNEAKKNEKDRPLSCYDRFAIAKKFHAENLEHQPLPDRVDDSVFKNLRPSNGGKNPLLSSSQKRPSSETSENGRRSNSRFGQKIRAGVQYGRTLGCKTPTTNMDLAICWEAPLDPTYEPPRAVHIDGTYGGPAPAIFELVQHEFPRHEAHKSPEKCFRNVVETYEAKFSNVRNRCRCVNDEETGRESISKAHIQQQEKQQQQQLENDDSADRNGNQWCCTCGAEPERNGRKSANEKNQDLCDELGSIHISEETRKLDDSGHNIVKRVDARIKKLQPLHLRNCSSCECKGNRSARKQRQRLTQSAATGLRNIRRNGLPQKMNVPRPRTPYAKRSFCIDTLTPPFSIVEGCRDADYPEHWRLTSVYQQSYKNPTKQRGTIFNYDNN